MLRYHPTPQPRVTNNALPLAALRFAAFTLRRQLDNPRNAFRRELLATRLDGIDALRADVFARLIEARAS
jgi:hypothetical protein